jgi:hypothetical protein
MEKVEDVKSPLNIGEVFLVPCIVSSGMEPYISRRTDDYKTREVSYITPVINHPHNDIENGQKIIHYHADWRFIKKIAPNIPIALNSHSRHRYANVSRLTLKEGEKLCYYELPVIDIGQVGITPLSFISKSKFKHKCIHKGKCPHRGMDLSQIEPIDGIITCPLHGLKFESSNGLLTNNPTL